MFCVGARLDTRPESPGADDNTSAVAALLELARLLPALSRSEHLWSIELVAFDLEENGMLGGAEHARMHSQQQTDLRGMVSLEMLGYCDHAPGSQTLPRELVGLYPDTGDFIAVVGNQNSTDLIAAFQNGMRSVPELPVEVLQVPQNGEMLQATRLSDHSPFWDAGFPALMITDTSFLRNPHYHQLTDTVDTLDFDFLSKVSQGCLESTKRILANGY
ncbi:MAG TPA: peptidase M28 [Planctomycetaceae bacterium]|nr:peptidase M28 [Planctomycetaceae bacterium]